MTAAALEIEALGKTYGKTVALLDVTLTVAPGEIFALLGPNGAGKTTLIGAVCGLVKKSSGKIRLFGMDLDEQPVSPRRWVGLVPQEINFDPFFTVSEALHLQAGYFGLARDERRVTELLEALQLTSKAHAPTRSLSGGMKRRLLIGKALVHRPKLLFLDEPTAGVDVELRRDLWNYVRTLAAEGTTVVLTTHYLEEAEELAHRVGVLHHGRLQLVESTQTLLKRMGEKRMFVTLEHPLTELSSALKTLGVERSDDGRTLMVREREGQAAAIPLLKQLFQDGVSVVNVETRRSRLEDVLVEVLRHKGDSP